MIQQLDAGQQQWVESTLESMTMEECVGHLLCPEDRKYSTEDWRDIMRKVPLGSVFIHGFDRQEMRAKTAAVQAESRIPVVIAADMENGAVGIKDDATTEFPYQMGCAAAADPELMYRMGRITALESRNCGVHWTFSPVADLNLNFRNLVTNIRSLGDNPDKTIPLLRRLIAGLQHDGLMAATAKHFPGDGVDERDQHLCTSVNSLPVDQWFELYGRVWQAAIDAGVMSIMAGHIAFPAWQGLTDDPEAAMPATLCEKLQIDLLRKKLGFEGVLVSDAAPMIGITSRAPSAEIAWRNIAAGSDVFLFADPVKDFERLMAAVKSGKLSEERVFESTRRVLEMKARLNLHQHYSAPELTAEQFAGHAAVAQETADRGITMLRERHGLLPLPKGSRILTVTISVKNHGRPTKDLEVVDAELRKRGFEVEHQFNPGHDLMRENVDKFDRIMINFYMLNHMNIGRIMMAGEEIMAFWRAFYADNPDKAVFTSFGNPYILYEQPHINNLLLTYGPAPAAQRAAVKVWCGELRPQGVCPVAIPKIKVRRFQCD